MFNTPCARARNNEYRNDVCVRLTDDIELHEVAHLGLGAHLALVQAGVASLHVLHLQIMYILDRLVIVNSGSPTRITQCTC